MQGLGWLCTARCCNVLESALCSCPDEAAVQQERCGLAGCRGVQVLESLGMQTEEGSDCRGVQVLGPLGMKTEEG
jgi:hypothetical protein